METVSRYIVQHAQQLAREVAARAVLVYTDALHEEGELLQAMDFPTVFVTRSTETGHSTGSMSPVWVRVPNVPMTRAGQVKAALLVCLARGVLHKGDRVVCLTGVDGSGVLDMLVVLDLGSQPGLLTLANPSVFIGDMAPEVFERVLTLATQLAVEGREGRPVGALFVLGDSENVLARSRGLVLNPFQGHPESGRNIMDPAVEETIKEFSALDGAFVVRGDGVVLTAGTHLVPDGGYVALPGGLGTRHAAAAGITASTAAVSVCVSQSTGTVTVFKNGQMIADIQRTSGGGHIGI
jgi:DNA integrity scanning protein DisA with diadenylate cyclase activity